MILRQIFMIKFNLIFIQFLKNLLSICLGTKTPSSKFNTNQNQMSPTSFRVATHV